MRVAKTKDELRLQNKLIVKEGLSRSTIMILMNAALAIAAIYLMEYWYDQVSELPTDRYVENIAVVVLTGTMYFVGKSFYTKGLLNKLKMFASMSILAAGIIGLTLLASPTEIDLMYPFTGIIIISIGFYMLFLSAGTLTVTGIYAMVIVFGSLIAGAKWFGHIDWDSTANWTQVAMATTLFIGGTWAHFRAFLNGIRGINSDGNGFGDEGDGDGDTENE